MEGILLCTFICLLSFFICIFAPVTIIGEWGMAFLDFNEKYIKMRKKMQWVMVVTLICSTYVLASCSNNEDNAAIVKIQGGKWDPQVRNALNELLDKAGKDSYAVFDFDQTSIVHDISNALWVYQIEHLCFSDAPAHNFLDGIPTPEDVMPGKELTYAEMGSVLSVEYESMTARMDAGESIETVRKSDVYLDFRARMVTLMEAMDEQWGSWVTYLWQPGLLSGYTEAEARAIVRDVITEHLGKERLAVEQWRSPDGLWGGDVQRGIWVSPEMKNLYQCLQASGIDVYVCSASLELIVEVLACDSAWGIGLPAEQVYGLRFVSGEKIIAQFDSEYKQPIKEGKVDCIQTYMSPAYGNAGPVLVAGDSNGDVAMLTAFPDMRHGLIIDVGRSAESAIGKLATQAREEGNKGRYLLQPSFERE